MELKYQDPKSLPLSQLIMIHPPECYISKKGSFPLKQQKKESPLYKAAVFQESLMLVISFKIDLRHVQTEPGLWNKIRPVDI